MKEHYFRNSIILSLISILMICIIPVVAFATTFTEVGEEKDGHRYSYEITILSTTLTDGIYYPCGIATINYGAEEDTFPISWDETVSMEKTVEIKGEYEATLHQILDSKIRASYSESNTNSTSVHTGFVKEAKIPPHKKAIPSRRLNKMTQESHTVRYTEFKKFTEPGWDRGGFPIPYDNTAIIESPEVSIIYVEAPCEKNPYDFTEIVDSDGIRYYPCMHANCTGKVPVVKDCKHNAYSDGPCHTTSRCECGKYNPNLGHTPDMTTASRYPVLGMLYNCIGYPYGCNEVFPVKVDDGHNHHFMIGNVPYNGEPITDKSHQPICKICQATYHEVKGCTDFEPATCTTPPQCIICGMYNGEKLPHSWDGIITCTHDKRCTECGETSGVGFGHDFKWVKTDSTCTEDGINEHKCSRCGDVKGVKTIEKKGHDWDMTKTCTYDKKCNRCKIQSGVGLGHDFKWVTTSATCTKDGKKEHKCARCGDVKGVKTIAKLGHDWDMTKTCTYDKKCNRCKTQSGAGLGHDFKWVTTSATCTKDGKKEHKCARCGDVKGVKTITKLGHDWNTTRTCTYDKKCNRCGTTTGTGIGHIYTGTANKCKFCGKPKNIDTQ